MSHEEFNKKWEGIRAQQKRAFALLNAHSGKFYRAADAMHMDHSAFGKLLHMKKPMYVSVYRCALVGAANCKACSAPDCKFRVCESD